ncbi:hypothetical protein P153DRAFT_187500 [Dothidotthia symphoricarpi CBS 119687]|uniref:Uncharacterized protein n=1 Tax=Dothidotthia symphoricarpi CBS 119687 TaxID=1392245 RepID=A0A6A6AJV2_9PLEO|nr:uncharacterized protein P153DRAFT_187500 [Dothidotthia symphoricarpi CBS 119687]KAF2132252.1 hypothetical protein P153DRAFT_187500 [Dothidotthia symphoricarpi CBS 119687]
MSPGMSCSGDNNCCSSATPSRTASTHQPLDHTGYPTATDTANTVFIVIDICYPSGPDFSAGKGIATTDSVHSTRNAANARAKKIIYECGSCKVDVDKIIEEVRNGLYTGIGVGGDDEAIHGRCYARKCEVERWSVDVDEDEDKDSVRSVDVDMG